MRLLFNLFLTVLMSTLQSCAIAQNFPNQKYEVWTAKDFRFHTGEIAPTLNMGYTTIGNPAGEVIVILHGTTGTGAGMLDSAFGAELFGPGQVLDAAKYFIVLPDSIGTGKSSKPSDGLRTFASLFYAIGTNGGNLGLQRQAPTRAQADQLLKERFPRHLLATPMTTSIYGKRLETTTR